MKKNNDKFFNYLPKSTTGYWALLLFIAADEVVNNSILRSISGVSLESSLFNTLLIKVGLLFLFLGLQIVASPFQASISDFSCRRKSLIFSLSMSIIAIVLLLFFKKEIIFLLPLLIIKGIAGNTLPIAWAGIVDEESVGEGKNDTSRDLSRILRNSFAGSILVIGWGYLIFKSMALFSKNMPIYLNLSCLIFVILALLVCFKYYFDKRDRDISKMESFIDKLKEEKSEIQNDYLKSKYFMCGLYMFLCWEVSFYSIQFLDADAELIQFKNITLYMASGYTLGTLILLLSNRSNQSLIKIGYAISLCSFIPIFLTYPFYGFSRLVIHGSYFIYGIGAALLVPSLFSILSQIQRSVHKQGKILGLVDSADTFALLAASIVSLTFVYLLSSARISPIVMPVFSLFMMFVSLYFNRKFKKLSPVDNKLKE